MAGKTTITGRPGGDCNTSVGRGGELQGVLQVGVEVAVEGEVGSFEDRLCVGSGARRHCDQEGEEEKIGSHTLTLPVQRRIVARKTG
jgi:hypothetical protein